MSDTNPNENKPREDDIAEQLNALGKNLREALRTAWESEDRRKLQQEIETGLANLRDSLSAAADDFSSSQTGQNLKSDVKDLEQRWRTGEVNTKIRSEITEALRTVNNELQKTTRRNPPPPPPNKP
jgi:signal recognition particle GTPase